MSMMGNDKSLKREVERLDKLRKMEREASVKAKWAAQSVHGSLDGGYKMGIGLTWAAIAAAKGALDHKQGKLLDHWDFAQMAALVALGLALFIWGMRDAIALSRGKAKMGYGSLTSRRHALDSKSALGGCQGPP